MTRLIEGKVNEMSTATLPKIVEIIEGNRDTPSGFVAEYEGVRYTCVSEGAEMLMDEAKEIGCATGRHFTQVLPRLLEQHLKKGTVH